MSAVRAISNEPIPYSTPASPWIGQLTTKLSPPRLRPTLVSRQELLDRISRAATPATIVCAPAGYGKSTLVTQWLVSAGRPTAWVSLDPYDNDPLDFFSLILSSIQSIDRDVGSQTLQLVRESSTLTGRAIANSLLEDIHSTTRPFVLVLDDYQSIENPEIHAAMSAMLLNMPPTLRVFIISRSEPPLQIARLRGHQELLELGHEDLRFTDSEAQELLGTTDGLELTPGEISSINERAEGWVVGLQLVSYVLRDQSPARARQFTNEFSGSVRSIENYLWEEVILRQPESLQQFLKRTSILSRFNAPLCDVVTGRTDSATVIRQLEHDRLFLIALDDVGHWYRYHHLFADVLRDRLTMETPEADIAAIHRNAAAWFDEHDFDEDAARHAFAGRDWERAVRLLEKIGSELYDQDRNSALHSWLQGLPKDVLERSTKLAFLYAYALIRLGLFRQAEDSIKAVEHALKPDENPVEFGTLRVLQGYLLFPTDVPRGLVLVREGIELLPPGSPDEIALGHLISGFGYSFIGDCPEAERAFVTTRRLADEGRRSWIKLAELGGSSMVLMQQGKLSEAAVLLRRIVKLGDESHTITNQQAHLKLGELLLEWNSLSEAERHFLRAERLCEETNAILWRSQICVGLARLAWAKGDFETAFDEIERAIAFADESNFRNFLRYARAYQARFWVDSGRMALARLWAEGSELDPKDSFAYDRFDQYLTLARIYIEDDLIEVARTILETMAESARANGRHGDWVKISVLLAIAHKREGNQAEAMETIERALTLGSLGGYFRVFLDEGEAIAPLLRHSSARGPNRDYANKLLAEIDSSPTLAHVSADMVDGLSAREIEVLRLVSAGLANRRIGDHLFISEKTVKKHLSNILSKLGAANRTQAVDQARRLDLI